MTESIKKTKAGRITRLAGLGVAHAAKRSNIALKSFFATAEQKNVLKEEFWNRFADDLSDTLGDLRGILLKFGQIMSYMEIDISPVMKQKLSKLQDHAAVCKWSEIRPVLEKSLGKPFDEVFEEIDKLPFASASIGQVHRATLPGGEKVAVKIQYPGIVDAVNADLSSSEILATLAAIVMSFLDDGKEQRTLTLVEEIKRFMLNELNYQEEARIQNHFRKCYENHPEIIIPAIYDDFCTREILVSQIIEGTSFERKITQLEKQQNKLDKIGEIFLDYQLGSLFKYSVLNGDPHPGNFRFVDDDKIACLDYGCFIEVDSRRLQWLRELIFAASVGDELKLRDNLIQLVRVDDYSVPDSNDIHFLKNFFELSFRPFGEEQNYVFSVDYVKEVTEKGKNLIKSVNLPHEMIIIIRVILGTYANLSRLNAHINLKSLSKQWFNQGSD